MENEKYTLFFQIKNNINKIRLLGEEFVRFNKNKGKLLYKNKIYSLKDLFDLKDIINDKFKIKILLSKDCSNKSYMFKNCSLLIQIKYENNINNIEDIIFDETNYLYDASNKYTKIYNQNENIKNINNKENNYFKKNFKITAMNEIFSNCPSLISLPDISEWDTSNIIDMSKIFYNCRSLSFIPDISKWDISNVVDMHKMFKNCISISLLPDLTKWNINHVCNFDDAFDNCLSLSSLSNFFGYNNNLVFMIKNCFSLISLFYIKTNKQKNIGMSSMNEKSCSIFKLIYEIKDEKIIKIFDSKFISKNRSKCKMEINNKIYSLSDKYQIFDYNKKKLKINLLIMNKTKINLSHIFQDCTSLKKFYEISQEETKSKEKLKEKKKDEEIYILNDNDKSELDQYNLYNEKKFLNTKSKNKNKDKLPKPKNKINFIYIAIDKNNISDKEKEIMNEIINKSNNFLTASSSFYMYKLQDKNYNENILEKNSSFISTENKLIKERNDNSEKQSLIDFFNILQLSL